MNSTQPRTLSALAEAYEQTRRGQYADNTVKNDQKTLRHLVAIIGNIQVGQVTPQHIDRYFTTRGRTLKASSLNHERAVLLAFFGWCRTMRYLPQHSDPMAGRRLLRTTPADKLLIPQHKFGHLLDCAPHPLDRIVVALGLYLFLRQGEVTTLRIKDLRLDMDEIDVHVHKSGIVDTMPICDELSVELRRWLTFYARRIDGPLTPDMYLAPAKVSRFGPGGSQDSNPPLKPATPYKLPLRSAQRALSAAGYPTEWQGGHTLRRSGARALYDTLSEQGHDRAMRHVQAMLHHKSIQMTEHYLGITVERAQRDRLLKGRAMFTPVTGNVVAIREA